MCDACGVEMDEHPRKIWSCFYELLGLNVFSFEKWFQIYDYVESTGATTCHFCSYKFY